MFHPYKRKYPGQGFVNARTGMPCATTKDAELELEGRFADLLDRLEDLLDVAEGKKVWGGI